MSSMTARGTFVAMVGVIALAGCASAPVGPSLMALPGSTKTFDQFQIDDHLCRQYASAQSGAPDNEQRANNAAVRDAAVATVIGAAVGGAVDGSNGAGIGAGMGLLVGSAAGADSSQYSSATMQRMYDQAYVQCMYGKGHKVPVQGNFVGNDSGKKAAAVQMGSSAIPPPPPGHPPPPPPDAPR